MMQWRVFSEHLALDQKEEVERLRDIAEYAMAFHNYEAVSAVQEARESPPSPEAKPVEDIFLQQVEQMFGKKLDKDELEKARVNAEREEARRIAQEPVHKSARQRIQEDIIRVSRREESKKG
jgi:hypothetical protein